MSSLNNLIQQTAQYLNKGGVVIAPTETLYGLSTLYGNDLGVKRMEAIKGRHIDQSPFLLLIGSIEMGESIAIISNCLKQFLTTYLWPGHVTAVFKKRGGGTIALRHGDTFFLNQLFQLIKQPLYSTSVNQHGTAPLNDYKTICSTFGKFATKIFFI